MSFDVKKYSEYRKKNNAARNIPNFDEYDKYLEVRKQRQELADSRKANSFWSKDYSVQSNPAVSEKVKAIDKIKSSGKNLRIPASTKLEQMKSNVPSNIKTPSTGLLAQKIADKITGTSNKSIFDNPKNFVNTQVKQANSTDSFDYKMNNQAILDSVNTDNLLSDLVGKDITKTLGFTMKKSGDILKGWSAEASNDILSAAKALKLDDLNNLAHDALDSKAGEFIFGENADEILPDRDFLDAAMNENKNSIAVKDKNFNKDSASDQFVNNMGSTIVQNIPNMILGAMSGGTSQTGKLASPDTMTNIYNTVMQLKSNPMFWNSFVSQFGSTYQNSLDEGADDYTAFSNALLTALPNSVIEIGGGPETLFENMETPKTLKEIAYEWAKSALEEGSEELWQNPIERGNTKAMLNTKNPWFSLSDESAVLNPTTSAKEFAMGTAGGALLGAGPIVTQIPTSVRNTTANIKDKAENKISEIKQNKYAQKGELNKFAETEYKQDTKDAAKSFAASIPAVNVPNRGDTVGTISSIDDGGNVYINALDNDGNVVSREISEVEFDNPELAKVYNYASDYNLSTANRFVRNYKENYEGRVSADDYREAFKTFYDFGTTNVYNDSKGDPDLATIIPKIQSLKADSINMPLVERASAYNAGYNLTKAKTEANLKKTRLAESIDKSNYGVVEDSDGAYKKLRKADRIQLDALGKATNTKIVIEDLDSDGQTRGYYDPSDSTIHINANAKDVLVVAFSHELTHKSEILSPEEYKVYKDYVINKLRESGADVNGKTFDQRVKELRTQYENYTGRAYSDTEIYDEIVANASQEFLKDADFVKDFVKKNLSIGEKFVVACDKIIDMISKALKKLAPETFEARQLAKDLDSFKKARQLWADMVNEASKRELVSPKEINNTINEIGLEYDEKNGVVYSFGSLEDAFNYNEGQEEYLKAREEYVNALIKATGKTKEECDRYLDSLFLIHDLIGDDRERLDFEAAVGRTAWVSNAEYGGSIDFSTLCAKRRLFTGTMDAIRKALPDAVLDDTDFLTIRNMLIDKGLESPCSMCYVEGSRAKADKYIKEWLDSYLATNPEWKPRMYDLASAGGLEQTRINHPEAYKSFQDAMNKLAQRKPKEMSVRTDYKGEILVSFGKDDGSVEIKNRNGGVRFNSFSDFEIVHALDCMQVLTDMSRVGLAGQGYTKVVEFAECFGNTGLKINLSLVAKGVDENGKLIFDEINGMKYADAMKLRNKYSDNVGTVIVAFTRQQIKAALADPTIDYVLPFHRSQWKKAQYVLMGLPKGTKDFTMYQNDRITNPATRRPVKLTKLKKSTTYTNKNTGETFTIKDNIMPNMYWDYGKTGRENAQEYLNYINDNKMTPKFDFLLDKVNGKWMLPEGEIGDGYFKLLIDFKMYNNEGVGSPQMPVLPEFNMPYIDNMLTEYKGGHESFPVAQEVVDEFLAYYKKKHKIKKNTRLSLSPDDFYNEYLTDDMGYGIKYSLRKEDPPKKTGKAYKVFLLKNGKLYPPMVANPNGEGTPVGTWLNADAAPRAADSKTGRPQVQAGGKGTNTGKTTLAYRPGWHLGDIPQATQFAKLNPETGVKELFPSNFVWAECEYAMDVDYQEEAMSYGYNKNGKFQHSLAGLPKIPIDGYYRYRTNPNPNTVPWVITGAMKVNRILTDDETDAICRANGVNPLRRQGGRLTENKLSEMGIKKLDYTMDYTQNETNSGIRLSLYPEDNKSYSDFAEKFFGTTHNWNETGYLLKNGKKLDFSGKNEGAPAGRRTVDHREINSAFYDIDTYIEEGRFTKENLPNDRLVNQLSELDGTEAMIDFMNRGNIRIMPETNGINLSVEPSKSQYEALNDFVSKNRGEVMLDIDDENGNTIFSMEYPRGTYYSKVINDIKNYFSEGTVPHKSVVSDFHNRFSLTPEERAIIGDLDEFEEILGSDDVKDIKTGVSEMLPLIKGKKVTPKAARKIAKHFVEYTASGKYYKDEKFDELSEKLFRVFNYMSEANAVNIKEITDVVTGIASGLVKNSDTQIDLDPEMKDFKDTIRNMRIYIPEDVRRSGEFDVYGGWNEFRKRAFGKLRLVNDPVRSLRYDEVFSQLNGYMNYFNFGDSDITENSPAEVLAKLLDVYDSLKPTYINPFDDIYGMSLEESSMIIAWDILSEGFDAIHDAEIEDVKRIAKDEKKKAVTKEREKAAERLAKQNEKFKQKIEDIKKKQRKKNKEKDKKTVNRLIEARAKVRERYKESNNKTKYRSRIDRNIKELNNMLLRPTDKKHIPLPLQKPLAAFLESIDTSSKRTNKDGDPTKRTLAWYKLSEAYTKIQSAPDDFDYVEIDPDLIAKFNDLTNSVENLKIDELNASQLKTLSEVVSAVKHSVTEANKLLAISQNERVQDLATRFIDNAAGVTRREIQLFSGADKLFNYSQLDSYSYFKKFGKVGDQINKALLDSLDRKITHEKEAMDYMQKALAEEGFEDISKLSGKKAEVYDFDVSGGKIRLNKSQIMSLRELVKREQARSHIFGGGVKVGSLEIKEPLKFGGKEFKINLIKLSEKLKQENAIKLTEEDVAKILQNLTPQEARLADKMQWFFNNVVNKWGNEVSRKLYGYDKFTEKNYFQIVSDKDYLNSMEGNFKADENVLKNIGFTKGTVKNANNPIMIEDIFDVYTRHVEQMAMYNAFVPTLSDMNKFINYKQKAYTVNDDGSSSVRYDGSVKNTMGRAYGQEALSYWHNLIRDINGASVTAIETSHQKSLMSRVKRASVGGNFRVVIQQPTAYVRAAAVISPKYLAKALTKKSDFEKVKKYAPIAVLKDWGYFETGIGRQMKNVFIGKKTLSDKSMELAGKADNVTWGKLWNAVELEISDTRPDLKAESDEYYTACKDRFNEVIAQTQVVDSVLHRSQIMRSKDMAVQMATSFMAEPTKTYNMLRNAIVDIYSSEKGEKRGKAKKNFARVATVHALTCLATAVAQSIVDVFRDDDDEKKLQEKAGGILLENYLENINPLTLVPVVKDVWSIIEGYSPERMDMSGITDVLTAAKKWLKFIQNDDESGYTVFSLASQTAKALSTATGIPVGNIMRTFENAVGAVFDTAEALGADVSGERYAKMKAYWSMSKSTGKFIDLAVKARTEGNSKLMNKIRNDLISKGFKPSDIDEKIKYAASDVLKGDKTMLKLYEAYKEKDYEKVDELTGELYSRYFTEEEIKSALNSLKRKEANEEEKDDEEIDSGEYTSKDVSIWTYEDLANAYIEQNGMYGEMRDELISVNTSDDPEGAVTKALKSKLREIYRECFNKDEELRVKTFRALKRIGYSDKDIIKITAEK